jgi:hypothetical protein
MKNHIELLRKLSPELFGGNAVHLFGDWSKGPRRIAILYHTLGYYMSNGSNPVNMPKIAYCPGFRYTVLDYINPLYNYIYKDVYVNRFALPKMYKNVLTQTQPLTRKIRIKPKQGISFKEAQELRQNFIDKANIDITTALPTRNDCEEYTNQCYDALTKLLEKADLIDNEHGLNQKKGSVILAEELNNLLFNQNIISEKQDEIRYALSLPVADKIMADIRLHKEIMFGEIRHTYKRHR